MGRALFDPLSVEPIDALEDRARKLEERLQAISGIPAIPLTGVNLDDSWRASITNLNYVYNNYFALSVRCMRSGLRIEQPWVTPAGTTGELKMEVWTLFGPTGGDTATIALPAASSGSAVWNYEHSLAKGAGVFSILCMARRPSGTGTVLVGHPQIDQVDLSGCSTTGV